MTFGLRFVGFGLWIALLVRNLFSLYAGLFDFDLFILFGFCLLLRWLCFVLCFDCAGCLLLVIALLNAFVVCFGLTFAGLMLYW